MTAVVVVGIVAAVALVALSLQVLARQLRSLPLDQRRADPLIDVSSRATGSMRPAELHQLTTIVANAVLSDASNRTELQPILDGLEDGAPPRPSTSGSATGRSDQPERESARRRPGGRSRRSDRIDQAIAALERRWGVAGADRSSRH